MHRLLNDAERRYRLRRLDDLLEALEALNLAGASGLPPEVQQRLDEEGITLAERADVSQLIELVWAKQKQYLLAVPSSSDAD